MRKTLILLAMLVLLLVVADFGLRSLAQERVSRELEESLDLSTAPSVSLGGFPFLPKLLSGRFPEVSVRARDIVSEGVSIHGVRLSLREVTFSPRDLVSGRRPHIHVLHGEGTANMTGGDITAALREGGLPVDVRLESGRAIVGAAAILPGEIEASLSLRGGSIVLTPLNGAIPAGLSIDLPELMPGVRYTDLSVKGSRALLGIRLANAILPSA